MEHPIDPKRVYVAGLSAGGAAAAIMGATYRDHAAVGVHSGLACGAASDLPSALAAMRQGNAGAIGTAGLPVPTIVFHGDRDNTVHPSNADLILGRPREGESQHEDSSRSSAWGHAYTRTILTDGGGWATSEHWIVHGAGHAWSGRQSRRILHRSARAGRDQGDAAFLSRAFTCKPHAKIGRPDSPLGGSPVWLNATERPAGKTPDVRPRPVRRRRKPAAWCGGPEALVRLLGSRGAALGSTTAEAMPKLARAEQAKPGERG
ncbi:PHB depolymerase family esterase [Bradyrhizobium sp. RDM4]|uniref:PHB depolymerase family esterase n=1 Tax=Bradyrhizobium sp. RDM4 TaxID=3378765 RepID=UPI0038FCBC88